MKQKREIETVRAREEAEIARVEDEERLRAQTRASSAPRNSSASSTRTRSARSRSPRRTASGSSAIESERIEKDRLLEVIARERETELTRIAAEKEVEAEKREIAEVIRERVAVDRTVAEQEESS